MDCSKSHQLHLYNCFNIFAFHKNDLKINHRSPAALNPPFIVESHYNWLSPSYVIKEKAKIAFFITHIQYTNTPH